MLFDSVVKVVRGIVKLRSAGGNLITSTTDGSKERLDVDTGLNVYQDPVAPEATLVMLYGHHEVHQGRAFSWYHEVTLGVSATRDIRVTTASGARQSHWGWTIIGTGKGDVTVYEGGNVTGGTSISTTNRNRNSSNTSVLTVAYSPTVTTTGTEIDKGVFNANSPIGSASAGSVQEFVLKSNTTYLVRITSGAAGNDIFFKGYGYEHTDATV